MFPKPFLKTELCLFCRQDGTRAVRSLLMAQDARVKRTVTNYLAFEKPTNSDGIDFGY
jgi:hypothetical protein